MSVLSEDIVRITSRSINELNELQGKDVLLTGAGGFLGYEFVNVLSQVGNNDGRAPIKLVVCDNFKRGRPSSWFDEILKLENVTLLEHDITTPLPDSLPDFDYIIHAASIASPIYYRKFPIQTIDANVNGVRNLLDYAKTRLDCGKPISGFLFFSTSEIYGDPSAESIPTKETYRGFVSCTGPRACYDESKRLGETLCVNFSQIYGMPVKIARPFNNYGPGLALHDGRLLPDLFGNVLKHSNIELLSDGSATRTFCYISDAIEGYLKVLVFGRPGEAYNIGTDAPEISVFDLACKVKELAKELFGYSGQISFKNSSDPAYLVDNPNRRCPDIEKAKSELGYSPLITLDQGLRNSLNWHRSFVS